jgi:excisionase family DNA binding protein
MKLYTATEAAEMLGMSYDWTVQRLESKEISGYKIGNRWRVSQDDIDAYLRQARSEKVYTIGKRRLKA